MPSAELDHQLHVIWEELKAVAPTTSKRFRDFQNFRDVTRAMPAGGSVELIDPSDTFKQSNIRILGPDGEPAAPAPEGVMPEVTPEPETVTPEVTPEPETVTPEVTPEPETVTPEVTPEPETVTPEVTPEPETVTPQVPIAPDQNVPEVGGATDQGLIDVNPVDPKKATRKRARFDSGRFRGDDPTTLDNEAWVIE